MAKNNYCTDSFIIVEKHNELTGIKNNSLLIVIKEHIFWFNSMLTL